MGTHESIPEKYRPFVYFMYALQDLGLRSAHEVLKQSIYEFDGQYHIKDDEGNFYATILLGHPDEA